MVLVAALVAEKDRGSAVLGDEQVGRAVVVVVAGDDGARIFQADFVEADFRRDILEAVRAEIAEQAHFAFTFGRLPHCNEVNPAVIVVVERSHTKPANPGDGGQCNLLELSMIVAPKREAGRPPVCKRKVHPAVVVEVEHGEPRGWRVHWRGPRRTSREFSLPRIFKDRGCYSASHHQVHCTIVVVIRTDRAEARLLSPQSRRIGNIGECAVAVVAPHNIGPGHRLDCGRSGRWPGIELGLVTVLRDIKIQVAVVIVIDECEAYIEARAYDAGCSGRIPKRAVFFVVQQKYAPIETHSQISRPVVVVVACGASDAVKHGVKASLFRDVLELAIAQVVIERHAPLWTIVRQEDILLAVSVIVQEASAGTQEGRQIAGRV